MGNNEGLGKLYLIPIELGNVEVEQYQPQRILELLGRLRYYVVEMLGLLGDICPGRCQG